LKNIRKYCWRNSLWSLYSK